MIRRVIRFGLLASSLAAGGLLALATTARDRIDGSGVPATEERSVGDVSAVELAGVGELTIVPGAAPSLSVTADDNVLPALETESANGRLTLRTKSRVSINTKTKIAYTLTVPRLDSVTVSGAGSVRAHRLDSDDLKVKLSGAGKAHLDNITCKSLKLELSGAGSAALGGAAEQFTLRLSGAGGVDAARLKANSADVRVSGAGNATVWVEGELKVRVSGAGGVKYKGHPAQIEQKASGAGRIRPLE